MTLYNLVMVFNQDESKVLMCYRSNDPYKGLYNLLGGKIEDDENYLESAYRELFEESGISRNDISLKHFMDYTWYPLNMGMKVYTGTLNKEVVLVDEIHKLYWKDVNSDFFDMSMYAGEGNIGHMMEIYLQVKNK